MKTTQWLSCGALFLGLSFLPQHGMGEIPAGTWHVNISDPTNHLWDASSIPELQHVSFDISEEGTDISFEAPFVQTGAGKLAGAGATELEVSSPIFEGTIDANYKANGTIKSAAGIARLTFTASATGPVEIDGKNRALTGKLAVNVLVDSPQQAVYGTYSSTGTASGIGSIKEDGLLDITWDDVVSSMGNGSWTLTMDLTNDGVKKIGGAAKVTLSSNAELEFVVKGTYKSTSDTSVLVLAPTAASKGSTLKVNLTGSTVTSIQGKVSGQAVRWHP